MAPRPNMAPRPRKQPMKATTPPSPYGPRPSEARGATPENIKAWQRDVFHWEQENRNQARAAHLRRELERDRIRVHEAKCRALELWQGAGGFLPYEPPREKMPQGPNPYERSTPEDMKWARDLTRIKSDWGRYHRRCFDWFEANVYGREPQHVPAFPQGQQPAPFQEGFPGLFQGPFPAPQQGMDPVQPALLEASQQDLGHVQAQQQDMGPVQPALLQASQQDLGHVEAQQQDLDPVAHENLVEWELWMWGWLSRGLRDEG